MAKKRTQSEREESGKVRAVANAEDRATKPAPAPSAANDGMDVDAEMGDFEDPFEDEFESDEDVVDGDDDNMEMDEADDEDDAVEEVQVYLPGQALEEGMELKVDNSAYEMLHSLNVRWPCLSFDVLKDQLGVDRTKFPHTAYLVAGSQADASFKNEIYVMKMSQLAKTKYDDIEDPEDVSDDEADDDMDPILEHKILKHPGGVNRIRAMPTTTPGAPNIIAVWSDQRVVNLYDISTHVRSLDTPGLVAPTKVDPLFKVQHRAEGFAMDWSKVAEGSLVTGDCERQIKLTVATPTGFTTKWTNATAHASSVEDLQWAPGHASAFASCSSDGFVKVFDASAGKEAMAIKASNSDVNVISWNPFNGGNLLASGHDDGSFAVWDLRMPREPVKPGQTHLPAAQFAWHKAPITSIEWHSHESSMLAVAGDDNQVTLWDFSTELDDAPGATQSVFNGVAIPSQLLFIHQGQEYVKEVHWHPQIPGCLVTTAASGFNIFKTINS
ncbi:Ribosome assembly protein rrb1 [Blastocladiella emersonii ATCC 22665]|nr:Ribosome assembly protein rrb1 [Blastocladiella emersonii ATCC 22665]